MTSNFTPEIPSNSPGLSSAITKRNKERKKYWRFEDEGRTVQTTQDDFEQITERAKEEARDQGEEGLKTMSMRSGKTLKQAEAEISTASNIIKTSKPASNASGSKGSSKVQPGASNTYTSTQLTQNKLPLKENTSAQGSAHRDSSADSNDSSANEQEEIPSSVNKGDFDIMQGHINDLRTRLKGILRVWCDPNVPNYNSAWKDSTYSHVNSVFEEMEEKLKEMKMDG